MNLSLSKDGKFLDSETLSAELTHQKYIVLPFGFERLNGNQGTLITNEVGEYCVIPDEIVDLIAQEESIPNESFQNASSKSKRNGVREVSDKSFKIFKRERVVTPLPF